MILNFLTEKQVSRLHNILDAVGARIISFYMLDSPLVKTKSDGTLLTKADLAASDFLVKNLPSVLDVPIVCEETFVDSNEYLGLQTYWLVDPIDGTKGFVQRNGEFCICVALIHENRPVIGAIYAPLSQTFWFAYAQVGSLRKWVNNHLVPSKAVSLSDTFAIALGSRDKSSKIKKFIYEQEIENVEFICKGSALKFTDIVDGQVNLYVKNSTTSEWDTAAGQVLVESIGGQVLDSSGSPLQYGLRDAIINPHFVACSPTMTNMQVVSAWKNL